MKVINKITIRTEKELGVASSLRPEDAGLYIERVGEFLRTNQSMGDKWIEETAKKLLKFYGTDRDGDLRGSSTYIGAAIATLCPEIPLIRGREILDVIKNTKNKTPFGNVYVDFGVQVNGNPETNSVQAKILLDEYKSRGIDNSEIWVPDFKQLRLVLNESSGLAFVLADDVGQKDLTSESEYKFVNTGRDGLFGACLGSDGDRYAVGGDSEGSYDSGRVVRYDAEGVVPARISTPEKSLIDRVVDELSVKLR